jgi:hypothetical protein
VVIEDRENDVNGIPTFRVSAIDGTITGVKSTWTERIEVDVPGKVKLLNIPVDLGPSNATFSGNVPTIDHTPPRKKPVVATVTLEIVTTPPGAFTPAYSLEFISCSVMSTQVTAQQNGADILRKANVSFIGRKINGSVSANVINYPASYIDGPTIQQSTITYITGWYDGAPTSPTFLDPISLSSQLRLELQGHGATSPVGYSTSGTLQQRVRPIFTALDGTEYYEVLKWTV